MCLFISLSLSTFTNELNNFPSSDFRLWLLWARESPTILVAPTLRPEA